MNGPEFTLSFSALINPHSRNASEYYPAYELPPVVFIFREFLVSLPENRPYLPDLDV